MIEIPVLDFGGRAHEKHRAKRCQPAAKETDRAYLSVVHIVAGRANCALAVYSAVDVRQESKMKFYAERPYADPEAAARS
jgi:hypothetical protein